MLCKCSTTCWLLPTLAACLCCRTLVGSYLLCGFVRADCALLCCAVLVVLQYSRCSLSACLPCRTLIGAYLLSGVCGLIALCCAVLVLLQYSRWSTTTWYIKMPTKAKNWKTMSLPKHAAKGKDSLASSRKRRYLSGGAERPDRCQRSQLKKKDKVSIYRHAVTA